MQSELSYPSLVEFNGSTTHQADCQETTSNFCLYFLRTAFGTDCKLTYEPTPNVVLIQKTHSTALKALAGLIAFTLWLPLTIVGFILHFYSETLINACIVAQTALAQSKSLAIPSPKTTPPPPSPASLQSNASTVNATATSVLNPAKPVDPAPVIDAAPAIPPAAEPAPVDTTASAAPAKDSSSAAPTAAPPTATVTDRTSTAAPIASASAVINRTVEPTPSASITTHSISVIAEPTPPPKVVVTKELLEARIKSCQAATRAKDEEAKQLEELAQMFSKSSLADLEYFVTDLNANPNKYSLEVEFALLDGTTKAISKMESNFMFGISTAAVEQQLAHRFSEMGNAAYSIFLPALTNLKDLFEFDKLECWKPERCIAIANLVIKRMLLEKIDLWSTYQLLWKSWNDHFEKAARSEKEPILKSSAAAGRLADPEVHKQINAISSRCHSEKRRIMINALELIGEDPQLLAGLFLMTKGVELTHLLSLPQLAALTRGLKPEHHQKLVATIIEEFYTHKLISFQDKIARVAVVPLTLGHHPLTWIKQPALREFPSFEYCMLHEIQRVLTNTDAQDRASQTQAIAQVLVEWADYSNVDKFILNSPSIPAALAALVTLSDGPDLDNLNLILDSIAMAEQIANDAKQKKWNQVKVLFHAGKWAKKVMRSYSDGEHHQQTRNVVSAKIARYKSIGSKLIKKSRDTKHSLEEEQQRDTRENVHRLKAAVLSEVLKMPSDVQKMQHIFDLVLNVSATCLKSGYHRKRFFTCFFKFLPEIKTDAMLNAAINAMINVSGGIPAHALAKALPNYAQHNLRNDDRLGLNLDPKQVASRIETLVRDREAAVRGALSGLPPELQNIVLDYDIALPRAPAPATAAAPK